MGVCVQGFFFAALVLESFFFLLTNFVSHFGCLAIHCTIFHFLFHFSLINISLTIWTPPAGLISAPVNVKVPLWSSGFSTALEARDKLMEIIKDKLENDTQGWGLMWLWVCLHLSCCVSYAQTHRKKDGRNRTTASLFPPQSSFLCVSLVWRHTLGFHFCHYFQTFPVEVANRNMVFSSMTRIQQLPTENNHCSRL